MKTEDKYSSFRLGLLVGNLFRAPSSILNASDAMTIELHLGANRSVSRLLRLRCPTPRPHVRALPLCSQTQHQISTIHFTQKTILVLQDLLCCVSECCLRKIHEMLDMTKIYHTHLR